jgi:formylglycine-generating enzyme
MKAILFLLICSATLESYKGKENFYEGFKLKAFEKSLALIPKGSYVYGQSDQDMPYQNQVRARTVSVDSYHIFNHEVSNGEYLEFVKDLEKEDTNFSKQMLPDTLVWRDKSMYLESFVEYYFRHPAYSNYPVVGVTHEQAEIYCKWLTEKYMKESKRKFKNAVFKLPSIEQWTFASKGGLDNSPFPWEGNSMQNKKGEWLANFRVIPQNSIGFDIIPVQNIYGKIENKKILVAVGGGRSYGGNSNDVSEITAPVKSFYPNGYGIYNMAGNVEEYVKEKGITKGGSWKDTGYYLQNHVEEKYDSTNYTSAERGFRFIMEIK